MMIQQLITTKINGINQVLLIMILTVVMTIGSGLVLSTTTHANAKKDICISTNGTAAWNDATGTCTASGVTVDSALVTTINVLSYIVGAAAVIMIIVGGFKYVVSGGDANAAKSARSTILYAVVGLVVVLVAQALVFFVLGAATAPPPPPPAP